jgi:hypothetical protein
LSSPIVSGASALTQNLFHLQISQVVDYRQHSLSADAASPNWHFITAMRSERPSSINDLMKYYSWKYSAIVLCQQSQIRWTRPKGFTNWPVPFAASSMA